MKFLKRLAAALVMVGFDALGLGASFFLAYVLRLTILMHVFSSLRAPLSFENFAERYYLLAVYLVVFAYEGLYTRRLVLREEMRRLIRGTILATVIVVMALFVTRVYVLSRSVVILAMLLSFVIVPVMRTLAKQLVIVLRLWSKSVVIVGQDRNARVLKSELSKNWRLGYTVSAVVQPETLRAQGPGEVESLLRARKADCIILSDASLGRDDIARLVGGRPNRGHEAIILLDSAALQSASIEIEPLESLLLMKYRYNLLQPLNNLLKRVTDVTLGALLLLVLLPLNALAALMVRLGSPGPIFFSQPRIGRNGRLFSCLKFRTMWQDSDQRLERMLAAEPALREEWARFSRITNDPRITPEGRFLRRFSLDEMPQLWNVLRGDMSLVGPRPYMPREMEKIGPRIDVIAQVRPGISGPFQTSGRKELTFEERLLLDEHYVQNWSLWMDAVIMLRTVGVILSGHGAL